MDKERIILVNRLVRFEGDLHRVISKLSNFEWDYNDSPVILNKNDVLNVLTKYINGEINSAAIEEWADAIELREDIIYEEYCRDWIEETITTLASPEINGRVDVELIENLIKKIT